MSAPATDEVSAAVRANAAWCDAVCRTHGIATRWAPTHWSARSRTPTGYPDAVTLVPGLRPDTVLAGIAAGPGRSVKDSFADLDLDLTSGFGVLFDASWIRADPDPRAPTLPWRSVTDPAGLDRWRAAHDLPDAFRPELLTEPGLHLFVVEVGSTVVAGVAVHAVAGVVSVSNLFTHDPGGAGPTLWEDLPRLAARVGEAPVVGYESGADLRAAEQAGFTAVAPLRVWAA